MTPSTPAKRRVLLIGWDAADWEHIDPLLEQGVLPTLEGLINRGVMGNLATLQPILSPMLWNSIATGKHAYKHGVHGFIEPDPHHGGARPWSSYTRKVRALWNILSHEGLRCNVVNWWASHPAEPVNGCVVSNAFGGVQFDSETGRFQASRGTIHPEKHSNLLARFKVFPHELTAQHILPFIPHFDRIDQENDSRLESFAKVLSETVTTHAVGTAVMELEPWDFMAIYYTGIDHFSHGFMQYHPPRQDRIPERDFEIFKDVIAGAYRFHDMMLERLLQLAGPETTVILCSDHGFQSRDLRPMGLPREPAGPAIWHRRYGIFVASGPGIKRDERLYGASLVDVAPTILTLFGLPMGKDMDGRPLSEIFESEPEIRTIESWEDVAGDFGQHQGEEKLAAGEAEELMRQFVALGYVEDQGGNKQEQAEAAEIEAKYNLAQNYDWLGHNGKAITLYEELVRRRPWESRFVSRLAMIYFADGHVLEAQKLVRQAYDIGTTSSGQMVFLWAKIQLALGNADEAVRCLRQIEEGPGAGKGVYSLLADLYLENRMLADAERLYRRAIEEHAENAEAYQGLSTVFCRRGLNAEAADAALKAVGLVYRLPRAHYNLGLALARSGDGERAIVALQTATRFAPKMANAYRLMSVVYRTLLNNEAAAEIALQNMKRAQGMRQRSRKRAADRPTELAELPAIPNEEDRLRILLEKRPDPVDPRKKSGKSFVLVSGLPRSGTSLMMQMLEAGGLAPKTDGERKADKDNPKGYYEWEAIKGVKANPKLMDEAGLEKKAIKCVSAILLQMPTNHEYKVIFMTRPVGEVVASQAAMIERLQTEGAHLDPAQIERGLESHRNAAINWMRKNARVKFLEVDYPTLVRNPDAYLKQVAEFLGPELLPAPQRMRGVIDASLYRKRKD